MFKLLDAFQRILDRAHRTIDHEVEFERLSITDRINELVDLMRNREPMPFEALFGEKTSRADVIVTFLALLEMTRLRMTRLVQAAPFEPILVELALDDEAASATNSAPVAPHTTVSGRPDGAEEVSSAQQEPVSAAPVPAGAPVVPGEDQSKDSSAPSTEDPASHASSDGSDVELKG